MPSRLYPCTLLLLASCGAKTFHHGDSGAADTVGNITISSGVTGDSPNFDGNYPEPAVTRCGDVLGDMPAIDDLHSAWAIIAVPGATRSGEAVESGSVLLRLSEGALRDCGDDGVVVFETTGLAFGETGDAYDGSARSLEVMFGPDELVEGLHPLSDLSAPDAALFGNGATEEFGSDASIELLHVDDDCVIGVIHGFASEDGRAFMHGGFVAQTCQRQCIPSEDSYC